MNRIPVKEQEPLVRAKNFEEVCLGYSEEEAVAEAGRCLHCAKPDVRSGMSGIHKYSGIYSGSKKQRF